MVYRYYLTYRPVDMGTCPRDFVNMPTSSESL
ncbi:hypothetical protein [Candidatus Weimeria sp. HCP3S3_B5]